MRVLEALYLVPEGIYLRRAVLAYLLVRRLFVDLLAVYEYRLQQLFRSEISHHFLFPSVIWVENDEIAAVVDLFVEHAELIGYRLSAVAVVKAVHLFIVRRSDLAHVFRDLYLRHYLAVFLNGAELVNSAEYGV